MWEVLSFADKPYKGLSKAKVKEKLKTSNYMMEAPANFLRHNRSSWQAAYQVLRLHHLHIQKLPEVTGDGALLGQATQIQTVLSPPGS